MNRKMHICTMLILAVIVSLTGCSDDKKSSPGATAGGDTPKETLLIMAKAVEDMDWKLFAANFDMPDEDKEVLTTSFEAMSVMSEFEKKLKETYSSEDLEEAGFEFEKTDSLTPPIKEIEALEFKIDGDTATAMTKDGTPMKFVKKDGRWLASMDNKRDSTPEDRKKAMKMMEIMTAPAKKMLSKIGAEGYTAKKLKKEYDEEMMKAMLGSMPTPPTP